MKEPWKRCRWFGVQGWSDPTNCLFIGDTTFPEAVQLEQLANRPPDRTKYRHYPVAVRIGLERPHRLVNVQGAEVMGYYELEGHGIIAGPCRCSRADKPGLCPTSRRLFGQDWPTDMPEELAWLRPHLVKLDRATS